MALELEDGTLSQGFNFGAHKSIAGELVFQTGMVGYPESITDPSYRGQLLVVTFPLVGNYGVPPREHMDELLKDVPAYFESSEIHIAGLIVASYAGEDYSHHLANSSLGAWLREQDVPAIYGVDTRALTKRIREKGSMLGRLLLPKTLVNGVSSSHINGDLANATKTPNGHHIGQRTEDFEPIAWVDPNTKNLVAEGIKQFLRYDCRNQANHLSIDQCSKDLLSSLFVCPQTPFRAARQNCVRRCRPQIQPASMLRQARYRSYSRALGLRLSATRI